MEDSATDVFLVKEAMAAHGLNVELRVVGDAETAIREVARIDEEGGTGAPDLALLDVNLPIASGFEVLTKIRGSRCCGNVPVVVMTSSSAPYDRAQSAALDADAYFEKPSGYDEFLKLGELVRKLLG